MTRSGVGSRPRRIGFRDVIDVKTPSCDPMGWCFFDECFLGKRLLVQEKAADAFVGRLDVEITEGLGGEGSARKTLTVLQVCARAVVSSVRRLAESLARIASA